MDTELVRVKVTRSFGHYQTGDELLVVEDSGVRDIISAGLFELIAVEIEPVIVEPKKPKRKSKSKKGA